MRFVLSFWSAEDGAGARITSTDFVRSAEACVSIGHDLMTDPDLLNALRDCYDPLQRRNIVELGLVQAAILAPDPDAPGASVRGAAPRYTARIVLRAPGADDARNAQTLALIENRLLGIPEISRVHIQLLPALFPIL